MEEQNITKKSDAALREERVLEFWKENKIFEKSLKQSEGKKEFVFYDGPVTANSKPVLHTMVPFSFKDAIPRYKTMRGFHVRRKGGWDTHGLPVELQIEKKLGLNSKKEIEEYGIAKFNNDCKESVWEYVEFWKIFTKRVGYWADQENAYVTYHNEYIESVWNIVKKINQQKLLYKDYKVVPWCPRCGTALSSHELAQGYEDVKDLSVYVKFKVKGKENTYILAWTTTPWTLPCNVALAVGEDIDYVEIKTPARNASGIADADGGEEILILAKDRLPIITEPYKIIASHKGKEIVGMQYEPLFPYLKEQLEKKVESTEKMFKVYPASFVNTGDGTGIVHTAVMYGQDDFVLGTEVGLPKHHLVNPEGKFVSSLGGTGFLEGRSVKEKDTNNKPTLDVDIIKYLTDKNLFFKKENYEHSYPHCWRCQTALIYYARDSWYIKMSDPKIKKRLINENQKINWEPAHIRNGRFGEWLREIKDWAISRERYWGTPLPVWICENCKKIDVVGSIGEIKEKIKKSGNQYFVMRHGGSIANLKNVESLKPGEDNDALTDRGREQIKTKANSFKTKPDIIVSSNFTRTKQTAEIVADTLGLRRAEIIINEELREVGTIKLPKEETVDIRKRMLGVIKDLENNYFGKNILIISHEYPIRVLLSSHEALNAEEELGHLNNKYLAIKNAELFQLDFYPLPRNNDGELDLHRPYLDEITLICDCCGGNLIRTKEVMDVWFDSGAMPFAQDHYPFDFAQGKPFVGKELLYPADFISEAIDQTRGWFYTLHAVGALLGRGRAYKNVICLGHLMDAVGKKMSKSLGNIIDPWLMIDKYSVDTLRLWMYSVNQPGESKNFDEKTVALLHNQVFGLLYNVLAFYELYRDKNLEENNRPRSDNVLDIWILARLDELIELTTEKLDNYKLLEPVRAIRDFVGDLSTWYLRRSRERIKNGDEEAKKTLYFVLKTLAKLMAPFAPFSAEDTWLKLKTMNDVESVHLESWPKQPFKIFPFKVFNKPEVLDTMGTVRNIVTLGLEARQRAGIKVRQPLNKLELVAEGLPNQYIEIIKDELNIKNVVYSLKIKLGITKVDINTNITPELKQEGKYRELARTLQDMRKNLGLTPRDIVAITFETNAAGKKLIQKFENDMKKTVLVSKIEFLKNDGEEVKIDDLVFRVKIDK